MEAVTKWGKPTYMHAGRNVAMAAGFKHHCGLWFFDGALLSDPLQVLENAQEGKTQAMRHWKFSDPDAPSLRRASAPIWPRPCSMPKKASAWRLRPKRP